MFIVRFAGDHLYGKLLFTWLSLVMSLMVSFYAVLFPTRCLGWDLGLNWVSFWGFSYLLFCVHNISWTNVQNVIKFWSKNRRKQEIASIFFTRGELILNILNIYHCVKRTKCSWFFYYPAYHCCLNWINLPHSFSQANIFIMVYHPWKRTETSVLYNKSGKFLHQ